MLFARTCVCARAPSHLCTYTHECAVVCVHTPALGFGYRLATEHRNARNPSKRANTHTCTHTHSLSHTQTHGHTQTQTQLKDLLGHGEGLGGIVDAVTKIAKVALTNDRERPPGTRVLLFSFTLHEDDTLAASSFLAISPSRLAAALARLRIGITRIITATNSFVPCRTYQKSVPSTFHVSSHDRGYFEAFVPSCLFPRQRVLRSD